MSSNVSIYEAKPTVGHGSDVRAYVTAFHSADSDDWEDVQISLYAHPVSASFGMTALEARAFARALTEAADALDAYVPVASPTERTVKP